MLNGALRRLRQRHVLLALGTLAIVALATLFSAFLPNDRYEATTVVSVEPANPDVGTQLVNFLIPTVEARVDGRLFGSEVAGRLPGDLATASWDVTSSVEPESGVLSITVASDDRRVPEAAANAYAQLLTEQLPETQVLRATVLDPASRTIVVSSRSTILLSGLSLAAILSLLVAIGLRSSADGGSRPAASFDARQRSPLAVSTPGRVPQAEAVRSGH